MINSLRQSQSVTSQDYSAVKSLHGHAKLKAFAGVVTAGIGAAATAVCMKVPAVTSFLSSSAPALQLGTTGIAGTGAMAAGAFGGGALFSLIGVHQALKALIPAFDSELKAAKHFAASLQLQPNGQFTSTLDPNITVLRVHGRFSPLGRVSVEQLLDKVNAGIIRDSQPGKPRESYKVATDVIAKELRKVQTRRMILSIIALPLGGALIGGGIGFLGAGYGAIPCAAIGALVGTAAAIVVAIGAHYVKDCHRNILNKEMKRMAEAYEVPMTKAQTQYIENIQKGAIAQPGRLLSDQADDAVTRPLLQLPIGSAHRDPFDENARSTQLHYPVNSSNTLVRSIQKQNAHLFQSADESKEWIKQRYYATDYA